MSKRIKQKYSIEFRDSAVSLVLKSDKAIGQIAKDLGIKETTLYGWVNKAKAQKDQTTGKNNEQFFDEIKRLKKELSEVKEQRDILKKATAYFAREIR